MRFTESLRKNTDFHYLYDNGQYKKSRYFIMYVLSNGRDYNRLGISISKKVGNSVVRHRIKRLVKESYRINEAMYNKGYDIVVIMRFSSIEASYNLLEFDLIKISKRCGIIRNQ